MLPSELFVFDAYLDVLGISGLEMMHKLLGAAWADDMEGAAVITKIRAEPAGQPEVGNANRMVTVKMGEQKGIDPTDGNTKLVHPDGRASSGVDQKGLVARFDQGAWPKAIGTGDRHPRPKQGNAKIGGH